MRAFALAALAPLAFTGTLAAQSTAAPPVPPALPAPSVVPAPARPVPAADQQIAAAVLPLPESMRAGARVLGYGPGGMLLELRAGAGAMTCLADDPRDERFHVACYHSSMEPYMARGRELRGRGIENPALDSIRRADVLAGRIRLPSAATLYSLTGAAATYDVTTNTVRGARPLYVVYVPFATGASLGLPELPAPNQPWIMHPGQPGAHVMFVPDMR